jgi:predicted secreted protein
METNMSINRKLALVCLAAILSIASINSSMAQKKVNEVGKSQITKRVYSITTPAQIENGAVVPIIVSFNPPLQKGEEFLVLQNGKVATKVLIKDGLLSQFSFRLRMYESKVVTSVLCKNCSGESFTSNVNLLTTPFQDTPKEFDISDLRIRATAGVFKSLVYAKNIDKGSVELTSNRLNLEFSLSEYIATSPFFGFYGTINKGEACLTYTSTNSLKKCTNVLEDSPEIPSTEKILLTCSMKIVRDIETSEIELDLAELTANGKPMKITENTFSWLSPNGKSEATISRTTGISQLIQIADDGTLKAGRIIASGTCQRVKTEKLF